MLYGYRQFQLYIKTDDICKGITEDVETRFGSSNYELERPLPKGKYNKVIRLMKDELCRKIMAKLIGIRVSIYSHPRYYGSEDKKAKGKNVNHKKKT